MFSHMGWQTDDPLSIFAPKGLNLFLDATFVQNQNYNQLFRNELII